MRQGQLRLLTKVATIANGKLQPRSNRDSLKTERSKECIPRNSTARHPADLIDSIIETACPNAAFQPAAESKSLGKAVPVALSRPNGQRRSTGLNRPAVVLQEHKHKAQESKMEKLTYPASASQVLRAFAPVLTDYEKAELLDYNEIYFVGQGLPTRSKPEPRREDDDNYGYDDYKGDYRVYEGEHIAYRYEVIDMLGKGSFGQAIKCFDHKTKQMVALKMIRSKKRFYYQATVEVKILKYIKENDIEKSSNVVAMLDFFMFRKHIV